MAQLKDCGIKTTFNTSCNSVLNGMSGIVNKIEQ